MPFIIITKPAVGDPTKKSLIDDIVDDLTFLNGELDSGNNVLLGKNSFFENDADSDGNPDNWEFTDFTGGTHALSTSIHVKGKHSQGFISTVLANGGGEAIDKDFSAVEGGEVYPWKYWRLATVANVSSKAEIVWYDNTQTIISTSLLNQDTNTPTTLTRKNGSVTAPSSARYAKKKITGGVPAVGTATGTIVFDNFLIMEVAPLMEGNIGSAAVNQAALKTATFAQSVSISAAANGTIVLTGGTYSWVTWSADTVGEIRHGGGDTSAGTIGFYNADSSSRSAYVDGRYIQSSPPWRFGSGPTKTDEIELFAMLILERATGKVLGVSVAQDPPWAYNGPTIITPTHYGTIKDADDNDVVVPMRSELILPHNYQDTKADPAKRAEYDAALAARVHQDVVVDMDYKNRDMAVIPHCWASGSAIDDLAFPTAVPVMLNPFNDGMFKLRHLLETGENVYEIFENGFLDFKQPMPMPSGPPGVEVIDWAWKP